MEATSIYAPLAATALSRVGRSQWVLIVLVIGVLATLWLTTRRRNTGSPRASRRTTKSQATDLEQQARMVREIEEVMAELDALANDIHGRLDARFAQLDSVIHRADDRIDQLSRLLKRSADQPAVDVTIGEEATPPPKSGTADTALASAEGLTSPTFSTGRDPIYAHADAGLSCVQIAEKLGRTTGEIELVLALRKTREQVERKAASRTAS